MYKIGQKVRVRPNNDNENYDEFRGKTLIVEAIYTSDKQNRFYDSSMKGMQLLEFITETGEYVPYALYEYEIRPI